MNNKISLSALTLMSVALLANARSASAFDIENKFSTNSVKVEQSTDQKLVRFSYCKVKSQPQTCTLLGSEKSGWYAIETLEAYKTNQTVKLVLNIVGTIAAEPIGFYAAIIGGLAGAGVGGIPGLAIMGFGIYTGKSAIENGTRMSALDSDVIADKTIDVGIAWVDNPSWTFREREAAHENWKRFNFDHVEFLANRLDQTLKAVSQ